MGQVGSEDEFLPVHFNVDATFRLLGNVIDGSYTAVLDYKDIHQKDPAVATGRNRTKSKYDLSESYTLLTDTNAYQRDTAYFNKLRPIPLTSHEQKLYEDFFLRRDTLLYKKKPQEQAAGVLGADRRCIGQQVYGRPCQDGKRTLFTSYQSFVVEL